jgi:hypothetical protein
MNALHQMFNVFLPLAVFKLPLEHNVFTDLTQIGVQEECE